MLTFTFAISCLTTSFALFMDLTFQLPMQYYSLQHQTLLLSPVSSTTGYCFCFGSIPSFFLELFLYWSPVAYWAPTDLGSSSFSILSFCLLILFMGFSRQEYEVVCHSLLQWTTFCQTSPPWPDHLGWPHTAWLSFIELDKTVVLWSDWLVFCDYGFNVSALWCLSQHLLSYLGFSYLGRGVSLHGCSSKAQPLLLTLDKGYLLMATPPDLERGVAPLAIIVNKKVQNTVLGCNLKNNRMISVHFQGKPFNIMVIQAMPWPVMLKKLKLNESMKTHKTF